ncbi:hypothetical protein ACIRL2_43745 [Embleya sp. NPDC127516]|uniref:hypothetical protein n=1 Tax=Embleya sp. NPDC127516 TaxID=3363990 RepID=UPI0037FA9D7C
MKIPLRLSRSTVIATIVGGLTLAAGITVTTPADTSRTRSAPSPVSASDPDAPSNDGRGLAVTTDAVELAASTSAFTTTPAKTAPALPAVRNLKTKPGNQTVQLSWSKVTGADDYRVYAAAGCDLLGPDKAKYRRVKDNLKTKTTWTHTKVTETCMNYFVVAVRDGREGARPAFGTRATAAQPNRNHDEAVRKYFKSTPSPGDRVARTSVAPGIDRGMVITRAFIRNKDTLSDTIGDHRSWSSLPVVPAKATIAWNTGTGEVAVYVHRSCAVGISRPGGAAETLCRNALPIAFVADAASVGDASKDERNLFSVSKTADGGLSIGMSAANSWNDKVCVPSEFGPSTCFSLGRINARATLTPTGKTFSAKLTGDLFPAWEFVRYPTTAPAAPLGLGLVLGTRDQTQPRDLTSGKSSTCTTPAKETETFPNPMSC